jgi:hypothetical protein
MKNVYDIGDKGKFGFLNKASTVVYLDLHLDSKCKLQH